MTKSIIKCCDGTEVDISKMTVEQAVEKLKELASKIDCPCHIVSESEKDTSMLALRFKKREEPLTEEEEEEGRKDIFYISVETSERMDAKAIKDPRVRKEYSSLEAATEAAKNIYNDYIDYFPELSVLVEQGYGRDLRGYPTGDADAELIENFDPEGLKSPPEEAVPIKETEILEVTAKKKELLNQRYEMIPWREPEGMSVHEREESLFRELHPNSFMISPIERLDNDKRITLLWKDEYGVKRSMSEMKFSYKKHWEDAHIDIKDDGWKLLNIPGIMEDKYRVEIMHAGDLRAGLNKDGISNATEADFEDPGQYVIVIARGSESDIERARWHARTAQIVSSERMKFNRMLKSPPEERRMQNGRAEKGMVLHLRGPGNPDLKQYADVAPKKDVPIKSVEEARKIAQMYREEWDLGGGNWDAFITEGGKKVAIIQYNLRVTTPEEEERGMKRVLEALSTPPAKIADRLAKFEEGIKTTKSGSKMFKVEGRDELYTEKEVVNLIKGGMDFRYVLMYIEGGVFVTSIRLEGD